MKFRIFFITLVLQATILTIHGRSTGPIATSETRLTQATELVGGQLQQRAVYVKGLVCSSCGIGLRVHLSKVEGIDKNQFKKGVAINAENQLVVIAFKEGVEPDMDAVRQAIANAGYEAAHYYQWVDGIVQQASFNGN